MNKIELLYQEFQDVFEDLELTVEDLEDMVSEVHYTKERKLKREREESLCPK